MNKLFPTVLPAIAVLSASVAVAKLPEIPEGELAECETVYVGPLRTYRFVTTKRALLAERLITACYNKKVTVVLPSGATKTLPKKLAPIAGQTLLLPGMMTAPQYTRGEVTCTRMEAEGLPPYFILSSPRAEGFKEDDISTCLADQDDFLSGKGFGSQT